MPSVPPINIFGFGQFEKSLTYQFSPLQSVSGPFSTQTQSRDSTQIGHQQFKKPRLGFLIPCAPLLKKEGDVFSICDHKYSHKWRNGPSLYGQLDGTQSFFQIYCQPWRISGT